MGALPAARRAFFCFCDPKKHKQHHHPFFLFIHLYYNSKYIITILESVLERDFDEIKSTVSNSKVLLTEEEIKTFLEQILVEEWC